VFKEETFYDFVKKTFTVRNFKAILREKLLRLVVLKQFCRKKLLRWQF